MSRIVVFPKFDVYAPAADARSPARMAKKVIINVHEPPKEATASAIRSPKVAYRASKDIKLNFNVCLS
jgi:hypothetical protein